MFTVYVRGKKDKDAVSKSIQLFYSDWGIQVSSLKGLRGERLYNEILARIKPFTIFLTGRRDLEIFKQALSNIEAKPFTALSIVDRSEVRNARVEMISHSIDVGRGMLRAGTSVNNTLKFYYTPDRTIPLKYTPEIDNFLITNYEKITILNRFLEDSDIKSPLIAYKMREGTHVFFDSCGNKLLSLKFENNNTRVEETMPISTYSCRASLEQLVNNNSEILVAMEDYLKSFLTKYSEDVNKVIIPWSGGKDSTTLLIIALEVFGKDAVEAIVVDTGVEFPETLDYIEKMARKLGINYEIVYAGLDKAITKRGLPKIGDRWCTGIKLEALNKALENIVNKNDKALVLVGDRDAESKLRVKRPPKRWEANRLMLAPLKLFGGVHIELYILHKGVELNPLYLNGFYRIGCYICPSLRDWEISIIRNLSTYNKLIESVIFRKFLRERSGEGDF